MPLKDPEARRQYEAEYRQRPEVIARRRTFYERPEIKERQSRYYKEYNRRGVPPGSVNVPPQRYAVVLRQGTYFVKDTQADCIVIPCDSREDAHRRRRRFEQRHRLKELKNGKSTQNQT